MKLIKAVRKVKTKKSDEKDLSKGFGIAFVLVDKDDDGSKQVSISIDAEDLDIISEGGDIREATGILNELKKAVRNVEQAIAYAKTVK